MADLGGCFLLKLWRRGVLWRRELVLSWRRDEPQGEGVGVEDEEEDGRVTTLFAKWRLPRSREGRSGGGEGGW